MMAHIAMMRALHRHKPRAAPARAGNAPRLTGSFDTAKRGHQLRRPRALAIYGDATLTVSSKIFTPSP
jgi:hypothetical protein